MARTKEFEEDAVLLKAMRLFWEQGYEKTSINDLVEHMGIHRRSLYDTFGDKHKLYLMAIHRYGDLANSQLGPGIRDATAKQAIDFIFDFVIRGMGEDSPAGCMLVNMAVELASRDPEAETFVNESFAEWEHVIADVVRKGQQTGEFTSKHDAAILAESLHASLLGLRVLTRSMAGKEKLYRIADVAKGILEP
ncbi:TetR/AcrR family transcriptional regulator [Paenibacillus sacheonensis]|uniref:TetR family transcriptional regulator n=1 Tax=Paenibacillus sacheonensis TaxID=742054 RepID=A0A7X4YLM0_9BACL|nr:TetR/AcrR family transcriptional regulator [Paenibacillus sacheonensis]MBM7566061.1 TetR/AcrR family transcriptional repressor of nem operon [Paenibacillus sacheonensis]NBC68630.1 TetR family transcriptional regulator [Paenibacillus sacheonensis]